MAGEILGVIEGAIRGLASRFPNRGAAAKRSTEAIPIEARKIVRTEAAHRDAANGDAVTVGAEGRNRKWDDVFEYVRTPGAILAVVPVRVLAAVREHDDRCSITEARECSGEVRVKLALLIVAASVQEHQQWPPDGPRWYQPNDRHGPPHSGTLHHQVPNRDSTLRERRFIHSLCGMRVPCRCTNSGKGRDPCDG